MISHKYCQMLVSSIYVFLERKIHIQTPKKLVGQSKTKTLWLCTDIQKLHHSLNSKSNFWDFRVAICHNLAAH